MPRRVRVCCAWPPCAALRWRLRLPLFCVCALSLIPPLLCAPDSAIEHVSICACDFLPPEVLRFRLEELLSSRRFDRFALSAEWLRERRPLLFWNLLWYCTRVGLPVPLLSSVRAAAASASAPPASEELTGLSGAVAEDVMAAWSMGAALDKVTHRCQTIARDAAENRARQSRVRAVLGYLWGSAEQMGFFDFLM